MRGVKCINLPSSLEELLGDVSQLELHTKTTRDIVISLAETAFCNWTTEMHPLSHALTLAEDPRASRGSKCAILPTLFN